MHTALSLKPILPLLAIALGPTVVAQEAVRRLAEIPEDIKVGISSVHTSNRGPYRLRMSLVWSEDGERVAYVGRKGDAQWLPVVGEKVGKPYHHVSRPILAGGHAFFHVVRIQTISREHHWLWVDGRIVGRPQDRIEELAVDADGKRVAFWTHPGARVGNAEQTKRWDLFLNVARERRGKWSVSRSRRFLNVAAVTAPLFRANDEKVLSCGGRGGGVVVVERSGKREKIRSEAFPEIVNLAASADAKVLAFTVGKGTGHGDAPELIFRDQDLGPTHPLMPFLAVDPAGQHVAYVAQIGEKANVAIDSEGVVAPGYDHVLELAFAPDGSKIAFVANDGGVAEGFYREIDGGKTFVVVRPTADEGQEKKEGSFDEVRDLVWTEDGKQLAYAARVEADWHIVCGDRKSDAFDDIGSPVFAGDGKSIGFGARKGRGLWWMRLALE